MTPPTLVKPAHAVSAIEIRVRNELSVRNARCLCQTVEAQVAAGAQDIAIDLRGVKILDVVGLAALLQIVEFVAPRRVSISILANSSLHESVLRAELLDELPFVTALSAAHAHPVDLVVPDTESGPAFLTNSPRLGLRLPTSDELALFERWANDPLLDQMVGSKLLYQVRHLGAYHQRVAELVLHDPTSITLVVEPLNPPRGPVGFVRLYDIHLAQQYAFLETAVASVESVRRGWGIEASRLLTAYALDALRLHRLEAKAYAYNVLSTNSLKRNGCQSEGVLRQAKVYGGQRWDILVFSILADEMRQQRASEQIPYRGLWSEPC